MRIEPVNKLTLLKISKKMKSIKEVIKAIEPSRFREDFLVEMMPDKIADIPNIPPMFHILAPRAKPTPKSGLPLKMEIIAEPNSGREVPIAAAVTPKTTSEIPKEDPISTRFSTKISAALMTARRAIRSKIIRINPNIIFHRTIFPFTMYIVF